MVLAETLNYSLKDAVASELLSGIAEVLDAYGHTLLLLSGRQDASQVPGSSSISDGFIVYGMMANMALVEELQSAGHKPIVAVDFNLGDHPAIHVDDEPACYAIAQHALKTPTTRIGIVNLRLTETACNGRITEAHTLLPAGRTITRSRLAGFHRALAERDISPDSVTMWNIEENTYEVCAPVLTEILDLPASERPDLLLCMSDRIALTAVTLAEQRGIRIPEDLRITGFDGIEEGQYRSPRLTTVQQDSTEKGRLAARMVLGLESASSHRLPTKLVLGETCP